MMRRMAFPATLTLVLLGAMASPLRAEWPTLGGQLTLSQPESNLGGKSQWFAGRIGAGLGLHGLFDLGNGHALRPRGDLTVYQNGPIKVMNSGASVQLYQQQAKAQMLSLGVDYNYFVDYGHTEGFYFIAGIARSTLKLTGAVLAPGGIGDPSVAWPASQRSSATGFSLGTGWRLTQHLGAELRFSQAVFKDLGLGGMTVKAPTLNASVTVDL